MKYETVIAEARVQSQAIPRGICGGHNITGQAVLQLLRFYRVSIIPSILHAHSLIYLTPIWYNLSY